MVTNINDLFAQIEGDGNNTRKWVKRSNEYFIDFINDNEILKLISESVTIILHGSTVHNIDDLYSDLDFWLVLDDNEFEIFRSITEQSFIPVEIDGKPGHINPLRVSQLEKCFEKQVDIALTNEVSSSIIIEDRKNVFNRFIELSRIPLTDEVKYAFFFYNYVEMRANHRSCDNPMERNDRLAVLLNLMNTIKYALRAAFTLDNSTYPYDKWLYVFARYSATPKSLIESIDYIIGEITNNRKALDGPEKDNQISQALRHIRSKLMDKARDDGINDLWLEKWWRYIDKSRNIVSTVCWPSKA